MSTKLNFAADCTDFLKEVRNDQAPKGWALLTYAEGSMENIVTVAKGDGNADELATHLDDSKIMFALVRVVEQIDNSTTIKFVHIHFTGPNAKRMLAARQSVHSGSIKEFFAPFHVEIKASAKNEVSAAIVNETVGTTSGQKTRVLDKTTPSEPVAKPTSPAKAPVPVVKAAEPKVEAPKAVIAPKQAPLKAAVDAPKAVSDGARAPIGIAIEGEDALRAALASVRAADGNNWALVSYAAGAKPDRLTLVGSGKGGVSELIGKITPDNIYYALTRHIERIDQTEAVKFAHVQFSGAAAPRMLKARIGTHKGAVESLFRPYHVDLVTEDLADITEANLLDRIAFASGTKTHVK